MSKILRFFLTLFTLIILSFIAFPFGELLQNRFFDQATGFSVSNSPKEVLIAAIDPLSFENLDRRWPWPRNWIAQCITNLNNSGARVIGVDITLSDRGFSDDEDKALTKAIKEAGNVVLVSSFGIDDKGNEKLYEPRSDFLVSSISGFGNFLLDKDGLIRRYKYIDIPGGNIQLPIPSFAYSIYTIWLGNESPPLGFDDPYLDFVNLEGKSQVNSSLEKAGVRYMDYRNLGALKIPAISFSDIFNNTFNKSLVKGKVVIIGAMFPESHDLYEAPGTNQELMYGVEIHAHAVSGLIKGEFPYISQFSKNVISILIMAFIIAFITVRFRFIAALSLIAGLAIIVFGITLFYWNNYTVLIPFGFLELPLIIGIPLLSAVYFFIEQREKRRIREQFSKFVAPEVVDHIISMGDMPTLGGERRHVTVLFIDIVGFTSLSEKLEPEEVVSILNRYFSLMVEIIFKYHGTVNKFIGDAIMVVFGAPIYQDDSERRAVCAALDMIEAQKVFNNDQVKRGEQKIKSGIGIHCGSVVVGNMGSERQMEYTVIGDTVNLSSRLEGLTRTYGSIIISDDVYIKVKDWVHVKTPEPVIVAGKVKPVKIHILENRNNPWGKK